MMGQHPIPKPCTLIPEVTTPGTRWLLARGYPAAEVMLALQGTGGSKHAALLHLYSHATGA